MSRKSARQAIVAVALLMFVTVIGCRPDDVFFRIANPSSGKLSNVKVSFPDDDFTISTLDNSSVFGTYRHFSGPGELSISYTTEDGHTWTSTGPHVNGDEKGEVGITIQGSNADFETKFADSGKQ